MTFKCLRANHFSFYNSLCTVNGGGDRVKSGEMVQSAAFWVADNVALGTERRRRSIHRIDSTPLNSVAVTCEQFCPKTFRCTDERVVTSFDSYSNLNSSDSRQTLSICKRPKFGHRTAFNRLN